MSFTNRGFDTDSGPDKQAQLDDKASSSSSSSLPPPEYNKIVQNSPSIYIIGSGDFGRALAGRLAQSGFTVTIASRDGGERNSDLIPVGVGISGLDGVIAADIVIIAIPFAHYSSLPAAQLRDKIVVDVSNRDTVRRTSDLSQAEHLAKLLPHSKVVKSFNVLSAYSLENGGLQGSKQVYVAGDDREAREAVSGVIRAAGFTPVDTGNLVSARKIEDIPVSVFSQWRAPFYIHLAIFIFLYALWFAKAQICWSITWGGWANGGQFLWHLWNHIPMDNVNKTLAVHSLTTLALCYLPGVIAGWLQIYRGTKYSRFPNWLDNWLKMRKQLGLLMLFAASIHACLSVAYMAPRYNDLIYGEPVKVSVHVMEGGGWGSPGTESDNRTVVKVYGGEKMTWQGECFLMSGVFGFSLVVLLGISSLPSVSASLTWKEFAFIQSGLGWVAMILLCAHDMFYGWKYMDGPSCGIPSSFQYVLYIPLMTILLKLPLVLPPLSTHLTKIRAGYVRSRKQRSSSENV